MNHLSKILGRGARADGSNQINFDQWLEMFQFNGLNYAGTTNQTFAGGKTQEILPTYSSLAANAMRSNGIVWACVVARMMLFGAATFQYRPLGSITSGDLYGTPALGRLESPWPGADTQKMLNLIDLHAQLDGNAYVYRDPNVAALRVARPDWMTIVLGSRQPPRPDFEVWDLDTEILGYIYRPNGQQSGSGESIVMLTDEIAHFMPIPDPTWHFRGMSWLQPVVQEIMGDTAMTAHKNAFLNNAATPNMVVTLDANIRKEEFDAWVEKFDQGHQGALNAYKTIYLAGGADAKVVGADLKQLDFRMVQAHGETRICNAAGIPPIIVGVSEGLDSATYSNYAQARRAWADAQLRPLWRGVCSALGNIVDIPAGSELWYDPRKIEFLQEDEQDQAQILSTNAATMRNLIDAGFKPATAQAYVETGDISKLIHTGLYSVQLQPPGLGQAKAVPPAPGAPVPPALPAAPAAALWCSLCSEHAGSNAARCAKCSELAKAMAVVPTRTVAAVAEQLDLSVEAVEIAFGLRLPPLDPFVASEEIPDLLTVTTNGYGL